MADEYGWTDERDHRRAREEERLARGERGYGAGRGFGPSQGSRPEEINDYGRSYADDYRADRDRGPYAQRPHSHERYLRERAEQQGGEHRGRGPSDYVRSDERIHEDVNERLADDGWLDASDIRVKVEKGEITLGGLVASRQDKRRAEAIADAVYGVTHVQNNLRVRDASMAKPGDEQFEPSKSEYGDGSSRNN
jgi:hypothetical protein